MMSICDFDKLVYGDVLYLTCKARYQLHRYVAYFRLSPLLKRVRIVVGGFGRKSCVSTDLRKPGNTCASPTAMI